MLATLFPLFNWLPSYRREWIRHDVVAGLTTSAVVIPKAMAYATIAGLPVQVQQARSRPLGQRLLGNQFRRQTIVEVRDQHRAIMTSGAGVIGDGGPPVASVPALLYHAAARKPRASPTRVVHEERTPASRRYRALRAHVA